MKTPNEKSWQLNMDKIEIGEHLLYEFKDQDRKVSFMPNLKFIYIPQQDFDRFSQRVLELYNKTLDDIKCDAVKCYFLHHCSIVKKLGINLNIYLSNSL